MNSTSNQDLLYHFLAPALLVLTAFVSFMADNRYSYAAPEFLICLAGLIALALLFGLAGAVGGWPVRVLLTAGLLLLFVDLQFDWLNLSSPWPELRAIGGFVLALILSFALRRHLSRIVTAVFATMLVSTVVLAAVDGPVSRDSGAASADSGRAATVEPSPPARPQLPILVHLILDEHIGIEGIPEDVPHGREMREFLRDFFETYGFRVFARAYSRYAYTHNSLPNLVNFASEPVDSAFTSGRGPYILQSNRYFELLGRAGHKIYVYQPDFVDFCTPPREYIVKCATGGKMKIVESSDLPVADKVTLIYRRFADLSSLLAAARRRYRHMQQVLRPAGWTLPEWWFKEGYLGPLPEMPLFDEVTAAVARASPGDVFFVHLLVPHDPYVYDAMCDLQPVPEWEVSRNPGPIPPNDRESRARRYGLYLEQMRCLYRKLDAMFQAWQKAAIFDQLAIVLHGDHGSRIFQRSPAVKNQGKLSHSDYVDEFSTLFAVKGPRHPPGYDRRAAPIEQLLGEVVGGPTRNADMHAEPYVFLESGPAQPMLRQPLPTFGDER
jgi:hypothetical protein